MPLLAQTTDPWFEIEMIAFERTSSPAAKEQFGKDITTISLTGALDLFKPLYQPDTYALSMALPACSQVDVPTDSVSQQINNTASPDTDHAAITQAEQTINSYRQVIPATSPQNWRPTCRVGDTQLGQPALHDWTAIPESTQGPALLPVVPPVVTPVQHQNSPYLVDESSFQLKDLAWQLKHRGGHHLLLHSAWRMPLGAKNNSRKLRIYAGQQFSPRFDYFGDVQNEQAAATDSDELQHAIDLTYRQLQNGRRLNPASNSLQNRAATPQVWQLDGIIRPYNQRMLFADTEFNFRQLSADGSQLLTFYSKENVRLLLGELHYLDHPKFGLIIQIRRFTPTPSEVTAQ